MTTRWKGAALAALTVTMGIFSLTAQAANTYTLVLSDGVVYRDSASAGNETTVSGLSYADGKWTMNGVSFETRAEVGMKIETDTTISLTGDNSISATYGDSKGMTIGANVTIVGTGSLTVKGVEREEYTGYGIFLDSGSLTVQDSAQVTAWAQGYDYDGWCYGIWANAAIAVKGGATLVAKATDKATGLYALHASAEPNGMATDSSGNVLTWSSYDGYYNTSSGTVTLSQKGVQVGDTAWAVIVDGVCTIKGKGAMWNADDWTSKCGGTNPLAAYRNTITSLVVSNGVTSVGAQAFHKFYALTNVTCAASVETVGDYAFYRCNSLAKMSFATEESVEFGEQSYTLQAGIYMKDGMPEIYPIPEVELLHPHILQQLQGSNDLENWDEVTDETKKDYHFFRYVIEQMM